MPDIDLSHEIPHEFLAFGTDDDDAEAVNAATSASRTMNIINAKAWEIHDENA